MSARNGDTPPDLDMAIPRPRPSDWPPDRIDGLAEKVDDLILDHRKLHMRVYDMGQSINSQFDTANENTGRIARELAALNKRLDRTEDRVDRGSQSTINVHVDRAKDSEAPAAMPKPIRNWISRHPIIVGATLAVLSIVTTVYTAIQATSPPITEPHRK